MTRTTILAAACCLLVAATAFAQAPADRAADSLFAQGLALYAEGQYAKAAEAFAATCDSTSPKIAFYTAMSYLSLNNAETGIELLRRAILLDPANRAYRFQYARSLVQSGLTDLGAAEYAALVGADSAFGAARYQLGLLLYDQKRYREAADQFGAVLRTNPADYLSYYYLSSSLVGLAAIDSARPYLASCISLNPHYAPAIVLLASIYYGAGEYEEALRLYRSGAAARPQDADLAYKIGLCFARLGKVDSALAYCSTAARRDTSNDAYIAQTGYLYIVQEKFDSAIAAYRRAVELDGDNSLYDINLAYAFSRTNANDSAIAAYERGVAACRPENIAAIYVRLGTLYYYAKQYRKALASYQQALDLQPLNKEAQFYVALAYDQLANPASALRQYRRYLALARDDTTAPERERKKQAADRLRSLRR
jgi:tetratricopeptide (TPR) repeat protein